MARQKLHRVAVTKIAGVNGPLDTLRMPGQQCQRERHKTKGLMIETMTEHVRYKSWHISKLSSAEQQRDTTKVCVV